MSLAVAILVSSSRATSLGLNTTKSSPGMHITSSVIKRSFSAFCPPPIKRLLYISLLHSKLSYCSQVWRPMPIKDIITLERIQHRSTKFITGTPSLSYWERLISLHLLPLTYVFLWILGCHTPGSVSSISWWQFQYTRLYNFLLSHYCSSLKTSLRHFYFKVHSSEFYFHNPITVHIELYFCYRFIHFYSP